MVNDGGFKKPMGFKGFVVTDYTGIPEMIAEWRFTNSICFGTKRWN
jgi:beta-glucosidase-like glycosyl hydrolase